MSVIESKKMRQQVRPLVAVTAALVGLAASGVGVFYVAGMFGLSATFASQIVAAVSVGGLVLALIMGLISGGIAAAVIATVRWAIMSWGKKLAIA